MPPVTRNLNKLWSSTLCLPRSSFPAGAPDAAERAVYLRRCTDDLYAWQRRERPAKNSFTLHDGPPYANGSLHIGHALNKVLKDIICRFQLSQGKRIDYVPGWDCHGLPIELKALEAQRKSKSQPGDEVWDTKDPVAVRQAARQLAEKTIIEQMDVFRGWGIMADWASAWKTMDKTFELKQLCIFQSMVEKGLVHRRFKPVYWSPSSRTALAEAELEYKDDHRSTAAYIKFPIVQLPQCIASMPSVDQEKLNVVIWTTTPWTIPANKAIAVHSQCEYSIVEVPDAGQLLVAKHRIPCISAICPNASPKVIVDTIPGADIAGSTRYYNKFDGSGAEGQTIIHADFVSADSGTGIVHLAPGHGMDDYHVCNRHGISAFAPVDDEGRFTAAAFPAEPELLMNKRVLVGGTEEVLMYLGNQVLKVEEYVHKYPYDWRTRQPVIVKATEQWFADVSAIKDAALASIKEVQFIPTVGRSRLESFIRGRSEWCISRQRAWGVPIPALYHIDSNEALLTSASIGHIMKVIDERGIDAWWTDPDNDPAWTPPGTLETSGESKYRRGKDTMDVWFDSGCSWTQVKGNTIMDPHTPADLYIEGSDQHRGWFQSSLLTFIAQQGTSDKVERSPQAPFRTLVTHGFALDADGRKMSKSLGNVYSPEMFISAETSLPPKKAKKTKEIKKTKKTKGRSTEIEGREPLGPDALRLWVASSDFTKDVVIGEAVLEGINTTLRKFRVTFKMLLGALQDFDLDSAVEYEHLTSIDKIALHQLAVTNNTVVGLYQKYDFSNALMMIKHWVSVHLSAFYIETSKDRLYADELNSLSRRAVQTVLLRSYTYLSAMLAPVAPLLVEESWAHMPAAIRSRSSYPLHRIHTEIPRSWLDTKLAADFTLLLSAKHAVNAAQEEARRERKIRSGLETSIMLHFPDTAKPAFEIFKRYKDELGALFIGYDVSLQLGRENLLPPMSKVDWTYHHGFDLGNYAEAERRSDPFKYADATAWVMPSEKTKCGRCWRYAAPADSVATEALCRRCERVLKGIGINEADRIEGNEEEVIAAQAS